MTVRRMCEHKDIMHAYARVHFVGIGGVGMCAIAEVLHTLGYVVSGSDKADSSSTRRLQSLGIKVIRGHAAENVNNVDVVVASSAIVSENPEIVAARAAHIPVVPRAQMLGELMRFQHGIAVAGTHGKTTTTSLVAAVMAEGGLDPTFVIGGLLASTGTNARLGAGKYLVAEADESDGSFLLLQPMISIVTNIDADHLENYNDDFAQLKDAFDRFLQHLPFYGLAILCIDDAEVAALATRTQRNVMTYGEADNADVRAINIRQQGARMLFDLVLPRQKAPLAVELNLPGKHNVQNALAAAAVAWQLGVSDQAIATALSNFGGIGRRFNVFPEIALADGGSVLMVDDYGHHPRELAAVIDAARGGWTARRLVLVFQPHRYTRTRDLMDDFAQVLSRVDVLVLTEVYAAGEKPIAKADGKALARAVRTRGTVDPVLVKNARAVPEALLPLLRDGDLLVIAGAGDIGLLAPAINAAGSIKIGGDANAHH